MRWQPGSIDGYCVGEPWNTAAVRQGAAGIATVKAAIWKSSPEKVLGVAAAWAEAHPERSRPCCARSTAPPHWCGSRANHGELARPAGEPGLCRPPGRMAAARPRAGRSARSAATTVAVADFFVPHAKAATFPWKSHALGSTARWCAGSQVDATRETKRSRARLTGRTSTGPR